MSEPAAPAWRKLKPVARAAKALPKNLLQKATTMMQIVQALSSEIEGQASDDEGKRSGTEGTHQMVPVFKRVRSVLRPLVAK